jgi:ribonuclease HI
VDRTIHVWTDGACTGNPGPMGIGVVLLADDKRKEISEFLGVGTNNIAELTAIHRGLEAIRAPARPVRVYTDSSYSIGVLSKGWKAKANQALIATIKQAMLRFPNLTFVKVSGHAGVVENERCDELARNAITDRR